MLVLCFCIPQKNLKVNWISRKKFHTKKLIFFSHVCVQLHMHTPIVVGYGLNEYVVVSNSRSGKKLIFNAGHYMACYLSSW